MNKTACVLGAATLGAVTLLAATAVPASAAAGDTTTTVTLTTGGLSVSVLANAALTDGAAGSATTTGQLGNVTVTDQRGGILAWSAYATSTTFTRTGGGGGTSSGVSYSTGVISQTGNVVIAPGLPTALSTTSTKVAGPTAVVGNNTASWNPTLSVSWPTDALGGNYSATVNTSVS